MRGRRDSEKENRKKKRNLVLHLIDQVRSSACDRDDTGGEEDEGVSRPSTSSIIVFVWVSRLYRSRASQCEILFDYFVGFSSLPSTGDSQCVCVCVYIHIPVLLLVVKISTECAS